MMARKADPACKATPAGTYSLIILLWWGLTSVYSGYGQEGTEGIQKA